MLRNFKLFAACVESLRYGEEEYEKTPAARNRNIVKDLQKKVDAWINWINSQKDE